MPEPHGNALDCRPLITYSSCVSVGRSAPTPWQYRRAPDQVMQLVGSVSCGPGATVYVHQSFGALTGSAPESEPLQPPSWLKSILPERSSATVTSCSSRKN